MSKERNREKSDDSVVSLLGIIDVENKFLLTTQPLSQGLPCKKTTRYAMKNGVSNKNVEKSCHKYWKDKPDLIDT
jgi:hypothetical protein